MVEKAQSIVLQFLEAFCAQDWERLEGLLAPGFRLEGPFFSFQSRAEYLAVLRQDAVEERSFDVMKLMQDGPDVIVFYRFHKPELTTNMAQLFHLEDGLITETLLIFDGRAYEHVADES